jgi:hypothetical protein
MSVSMATLAVMKSSAVMGIKHRRNAEAKDVCDTPNDQAERVMVEKMNASFMQFNMAQVAMQNVHNRGQNEWRACATKMTKMGMTPTPPWGGNEIARPRAHGLFVRNQMVSRTPVGAALTNERNADQAKLKVKSYENAN